MSTKKSINISQGCAVYAKISCQDNRASVGTVKWAGSLPGKEGVWVGVLLSEGRGDSDGSIDGKAYFSVKKPADKPATFIPFDNIIRVIAEETLLSKIKLLTDKVKKQRDTLSKLEDDIKQQKNILNTAKVDFASTTEGVLTDSSDDTSIKKFLENEIHKKWYYPAQDLYCRYNEREKKDLDNIFDEYKSTFEAYQPKPTHTRIVYTVAASPRDNLIGSGSDDKTIHLWRRRGGADGEPALQSIAVISLRSCINSLAFSPKGDMLAAALDSGWIELYDMNKGKMFGALEGQTTSEVWTIQFSPDGSNVVSGALDRAVRIWDVRARECRWALRGHDEWVNGVAVSPDGMMIVSGSGDKTVRVWDTKKMQCRTTLRGHNDFVRSVAITDNSKRVISASDDTHLRVWDINRGTCERVLKHHTKGIYSVAAGKGAVAASASRDSTVKIWDLDTGKVKKTFNGHTGDVNSCTFFGPNCEFVASGSDDKNVLSFAI